MISFINKQKSNLLNYKLNNPSERIRVIGITGTYGKTMITHLIHHILRGVGYKAGYLSSTGYSIDGETHKNFYNSNSVSNADILKLLNKMTENGMQFAIIEIPPKNLILNKLAGITFDAGVITNIRAFDDTIEAILNSKLEFIQSIREGGIIVLNGDEEGHVNWISQNEHKITNNIMADVAKSDNVRLLNRYVDGSNFVHDNSTFMVPFSGHYNILNALQAIKLLNHYIELPHIQRVLPHYSPPPGRMEFVLKNNPFTVIIDYAYNAEMLEKSLAYLKATKPGNAKIITVFGCAGERDKNRRYMGAIAAKYSDLVILTAEDPKSERVADINTQIHKYAQNYNGVIAERFMATEEYQMINKEKLKNRIQRIYENGDVPFVTFDADHFSSRFDAIDYAITYAEPGDIVYITGKGHEKSLFFNNIEYEWSDHEAVKQALGKKL